MNNLRTFEFATNIQLKQTIPHTNKMSDGNDLSNRKFITNNTNIPIGYSMSSFVEKGFVNTKSFLVGNGFSKIFMAYLLYVYDYFLLNILIFL